MRPPGRSFRDRRWSLLLVLAATLPATGRAARAGQAPAPVVEPVVERDVAVPMRDGTLLRADLYRPPGAGPFPVLVYRTPYGKRAAAEDYSTHLWAVERGYAVVIQDVRGRYASGGAFDPYRNEGRDGFDTIEWAAARPWSNGAVGTWGLSYPGAVQWLAAVEGPPHLRAMVPAMTFSTARNFFYSGGVFDASWLDWILINIAPDLRVRHQLPGPRTREAALAAWQANRGRWQARLPLGDFPELRRVAPFFFEWVRHPPEDPWWEWAEIRGGYGRVDAAVLNLSGWYDEAYGPEGATTNFNGLVAARRGADPRARLILGPWVHGVAATGETAVGELDFGPRAAIDYDELVLDWMDRHLRGVNEGEDREKPVRYFVMGENRWREADRWPPAAEPLTLHLAPALPGSGRGGLSEVASELERSASSFVSDPAHPVTDPYPDFGPHDYGALAERSDLLVFDSEPLEEDLEVTGPIRAEIHLSCDCPDADLWVKLLDLHPDGRAFNLMSPGLDVLRASYREPERGRALLEPGRAYLLRLDNLVTSNLFRRGHRIRMQISAAFFPRFSRNLQSGELETESADLRRATITIHHDRAHPSRLTLPAVGH